MKTTKKLVSTALTIMMTIGIVIGNRATAYAASNMTVDCKSVIREATHCANGSLYGLIENTPSDLNGLVAPLHPYVFRNPARFATYCVPSESMFFNLAYAIAEQIESVSGFL